MKTKIFLHIGINKTGTSAIQHFFNQNRKLLNSLGLLYPVTACSGVAHYALSQALGFNHSKPANVDVQGEELLSLGQKLKDEIEVSSVPNVVLSSENFVLPRSIKPVRLFFKEYDIRIVIYLRRHDDWWKSSYNQAVKMVESPPWGRNFAAFVKYQKKHNPQNGHYRDLIDRWAMVFGKENIIVRPYEQQQNLPDIVSDFLNAIGQESIVNKIDAQSERTNVALSFHALNIVDIFQRVNVDKKTRSRLIQHALSLSEDKTHNHMVNPTLRRQLIDENINDYSYIAKEFLGRDDGCLFYDDLPDLDESWEAPKHPSFMRVVEETIKALG